jgi:uncharacterized SAM-binding protein YcdF (DUF218 family)
LKRFLPKRRTVVRFLLITFVIWMSVNCLLATAVHVYAQTSSAQTSDVIVVLGAGLRRDNQAGPALLRRSERAADLYAEGIAPVIICTGGQTGGRTRSEADACREVLEANGVPRSAILLDERSRSTEENALYAHEFMDENGWDTAVMVSDGFHLLRAQWIFAIEGVDVYPEPATTRPRLMTYFTSIAREVIALQWQLVKEWLNLPVTYVPVI